MAGTHDHTPEEGRRIREAALDETIAESFPSSDVREKTERIVVTLIHGTFAPEAPWVKDGSKLRCAIQKAFPDGVESSRS